MTQLNSTVNWLNALNWPISFTNDVFCLTAIMKKFSLLSTLKFRVPHNFIRSFTFLFRASLSLKTFFIHTIELHLLFLWSGKIVRVMEIYFSFPVYHFIICRNISTACSTCVFGFLIVGWWVGAAFNWCGLCGEKNLRWIWTKSLCDRRAMQTACITNGSQIWPTRLDRYFKVILVAFSPQKMIN